MPQVLDRRVAMRFAIVVLVLAGCSKPSSQTTTAADGIAGADAPRKVVAIPHAGSTMPVESAIARLLRQLDLNRDGRVSREEHANVSLQMFHAMDADHNGEVTAAEMDTIRRDLYGADRTAAAREIAQVDSNHDGMLSQEEHAASTAVIFDQIDRDHDGFVTLDELKAADAADPEPTSQ
jgi:Ca2+-binding EF-hand superfamily protein